MQRPEQLCRFLHVVPAECGEVIVDGLNLVEVGHFGNSKNGEIETIGGKRTPRCAHEERDGALKGLLVRLLFSHGSR
jgi:hypothetical protein